MSQRKSDAIGAQTLSIPTAGAEIRLSVREIGPETGFSVIVLHGWGSSSNLMMPLADALQDTFRVVLVDFPGHGFSPRPPLALGVEAHADLLRSVIDRLVRGPFAIVGHSNGGRVALHLASGADCPDELRFLALISPSGVHRRRSASFHVKRAVARTLKAPTAILPGRLREPVLDWLRHSFIWKMLGSSDYRALAGVMRETFVLTVNHYLEERLPDVRVPVLLFRADDDEAVTREQMRVMERLIPDAGLYSLETGGHFAYSMHPEIIARGVRKLAEALPQEAHA